MLEQHAVEQFFNHHALVAVQLGQCFKAQAQIFVRATFPLFKHQAVQTHMQRLGQPNQGF